MDMTQLSCFIAVADSLNFAKAAKSLHLSQAAVSKRIKSLEQELNTTLFERSTRQVSLTNAGRIFYPHAQNLLVHEKNIINSLAQMDAAGINPVFIGSYNMSIFSYIDQVIHKVCKENPNIRPDVVLSSVQPLNSCLETHAIDIIVGIQEMLEHHGLKASNYKELAPASLKLICAKYKPASAETKSTSFASRDIVPSFTKEHFGLEHLIICNELEETYTKYPELTSILFAFSQNTIHCNNIESATSLTKAGLGFMILPLPDVIEREDLAYHTIGDIKPFSYGYYYCKTNINDALSIFTNELETFFEK